MTDTAPDVFAALGASRGSTPPAGDPPLVRHVASADGHRIAWSAAGNGRPPVLAFSGLASHLALDWADTAMGGFFRALASRHRLIRYDRPGTGLADRSWSGFDLERELDMMRRVLDACGEPRVALFARNMSAPIGMAFAARHPDRVSHLVLFGCSSPLMATAESPHGVSPALADAVVRLIGAEWGLGSSAVAQIMLPEASPAERARHAEYQKVAATAEVMAAIIRDHFSLDIGDLVEQVSVPTLVLHRRDDRTVSLAAARSTAERIPGARFEVLDGSANLPFYGDTSAVLEAIMSFLDPGRHVLTDREREVLCLVAEGSSNREVAAALRVSPNTVARHLANVFLKLDVTSRSAAVAAARRASLLND